MNRMAHILLLLFIVAFASIEVQAGDLSTRNKIRIKKKSHVQRLTPDDNEEYSLEKMELLAEKRRNLILDIKKFLRDAKSLDQKSELNLRLGSLYMEDYHANLAKAQQLYDRDITAFQKEKSKKKKEPKLDTSEAKASLEKARAIYRDLITRYPKHPRRDEMFYFLALSSLDKGRTEEAMVYFKRLSDETPRSRYVNDALIQLGDHYFDNNKFALAEGYFDKIIAKKYMPLVPYATYKKAWCAYNAQKPQVALNLFKWVIQREDSTEEASGSSIRIRNEAMKDITLPFADLKQVEEPIQFFKSHGEPHYRRGIETLASLFYEAGDYKHAATLYDHLLAMEPTHVKNPLYDVNIIEALKMKHDEAGALNRLFTRMPNYLENSNWYEINASNAAAIKEAEAQFEEITYKYGVAYHAEAQRTKNEELYGFARKLYGKYLEHFSRNARAPKVRFQYAEILYKQSKYAEAATQYYTVYKDPAAADLKLDAIRSALMSLDRQLNLDRKKAGLGEISSKSKTKLKDGEGETEELTPYSEVEAKFLSIAEEYLGAYPQAKDSADVLYTSSYIQYLHHDFAKAYKNFWVLVQKYPKHETAYASGHLILDVLNRRKDYDRLVQACKKFLTTAHLDRASFRHEVSDILRKGELKRIQVIEEKGEFKVAADNYIEYTKEYGMQDEGLFEKALYNASVDYGKAQNYLAAVETQEKFLRRFPRSNLRENMLLQVAKTYELLAAFDKAAAYYEAFSTGYLRNPQSKNALRLAGLYYWGAGNIKKAEGTMLGYMRIFPNDKKQVEKDLLDLYESAGATDRLVNHYLRARAERGVPAADYVAYSLKIAEIQFNRTGKIPSRVLDEAMRAAHTFRVQMAGSPRGVEAMSKVLFWYANRKEEYFYNIKLALPQKQLEINLQRKLALLKELEKDYQGVASLGSGEWGLGSIYKTASAYRALAQDVLQAPVPAELSAEQVELYRSEIEKAFIKPFNEKAKALVLQCLDKAQEYNVLSTWTPRCYSLAAEIVPQQFPPVRTFYLPPLQMALMVPRANTPKMPVGEVKNFAYPFYSFLLFQNSEVRNVASVPMDRSYLYIEPRGGMDGKANMPTAISYRVLSDERKEILNSAMNSEKPADTRKGTSFAFLNYLRLVSPQRAIPLILEAIQREPQNPALHNLLGLTYLENGNFPAAKVTFYALVARGTKTASLWNNLGVLAWLENREAAAIDYFTEALAMEDPKEALNNLGFIALKYRNGFEAKKYFEKALALEKNEVTSQVGMAIAMLQNRELDHAKDQLVELTRKYKTDPYARLSLGYFLIDVEKENELAMRILGEYMDQQAVENDLQFRQAMQAGKNSGKSAGEELPGIQ